MDSTRIEIKTPEYVSLQVQPAGIGSRGAALIIDHLILGITSLLLLLIVMLTMQGQQQLFDFSSSVPMAIAVVLLFLINSGYFIVAEYWYGGRTIGKKMLGIRVIQENGHSLTLLSSFSRNLLRLIDMLPVYYFLGMAMIFFHKKHKRLGDLVAGTMVVHERKAKGKAKKSPIMKEIEKRGIFEHSQQLELDERALQSLTPKEWKLLQLYSERLLQLSTAERSQLTRQMAERLLPKMGISHEGKTDYDIETQLLIVYMKAKDDWEYEE